MFFFHIIEVYHDIDGIWQVDYTVVDEKKSSQNMP